MSALINPRGGVFHRGNPTVHDVGAPPSVHFCIPASSDGCHNEKPACGNGAFHIMMTSNPGRVTCERCRAWLAKGGAK